MRQMIAFLTGLLTFFRLGAARKPAWRLLLTVFLLAAALGRFPAASVRAAAQAVIPVTTFADEAGAAGSGCSLREAITAANTNAAFGGCPAGSPGADVISLAPGTYTLSIPNPGGVNEDNNAAGDLDITQSLTIQGAGAGSTVIQAGTTNANGIDKVIAANPFCTAGVSVTLDGVTIRYGRNTQPSGAADFSFTGGGVDWCAGGSGETFTLSNAVIAENTNVHGYGGGLNIDSLVGSSTANINNVTFQNNSTANDASSAQGTGAGINIFTDHSTINITNSTFSGNQALRTNAGGGAIAYRPTSASSLTVSGSTFNGNSAQGSGGAAYLTGLSAGTTVTIQNSQFSANTATLSFGGGLYLSSIPANSTPYQLTNLALTGNHAGTSGGGLYVAAGNVVLANSRLSGNSALAGSGLYKNVDPGTATAANNWWGCSSGPGAAPCDLAATAGGTLTFTPWFQDRLTAAASPLVTNQATGLSASFLTGSGGAAVPPANLARLIGLPVTWAASLGSLSAAQGTVQASGTATATFTAAGAGSAVISARVDGDPALGASSNVLTLVVNKAGTTAAVTAHTPNPSLKGQAVSVSVTVSGAAGNVPTAPTGTITVSAGLDSCQITLPAASCNLTLHSIGPNTISAVYSGDANFSASPVSAGQAQTVIGQTFLPVIALH